MASFDNINKNLTATGARNVGRRASFAEATYYLDGHDPVHVSLKVDPVPNDIRTDADPSASFGNLLSHPDIAEMVEGHEKEALLRKKLGGAIQTTITDRRTSDVNRRAKENHERLEQGLPPLSPDLLRGDPAEWDHFVIELDERETAWLAEHPEKEADFIKAVTDGLRYDPSSPGTRQALITPIHKDKENRWHIQGLVHKHAMNYRTNPPTAYAAVDVSNGSTMGKIKARLQDNMRDAKLPFMLTSGVADASKQALEDRRPSPAHKEEYAQAVREAGGEPAAVATTQVERPVEQRIAQSINPEVEALVRGKEAVAAEGVKLAQERARLLAALEANDEAMKTTASKEATYDHAIAAIAQKDAAVEAQEKAEAEAERLRGDLEAERLRAADAASLAADRQTQIDTLTDQLSKTAEQLETTTKTVNEQTAQLGQLTELTARLEGERNRFKDLADEQEARALDAEGKRDDYKAEVEQLRADLKAEQEEVRPRLIDQAVAAAKATWERDVVEPLQRKLDETAKALDAARAELAGVPDRIEAAVKEAVKEAVKAAEDGWENTVAKPLREARDALEQRVERLGQQVQTALADLTGANDRAEQQRQQHEQEMRQLRADHREELAGLRRARDEDREQLRQMREDMARLTEALGRRRGPGDDGPAGPGGTTPPAPVSGGPAPQGGAGGAAAPRSEKAPTGRRSGLLTPPGPGDDFMRTHPDDWNAEQTAFAEREFKARQKGNPALGNSTAKAWGETLHKQWVKKNPGAAGSSPSADPGNDPKGGPK